MFALFGRKAQAEPLRLILSCSARGIAMSSMDVAKVRLGLVEVRVVEFAFAWDVPLVLPEAFQVGNPLSLPGVAGQ